MLRVEENRNRKLPKNPKIAKMMMVLRLLRLIYKTKIVALWIHQIQPLIGANMIRARTRIGNAASIRETEILLKVHPLNLN